MAKSSLGKTVSRVGASGGGKTYAKARPNLYYAVLALIVILGLSAVVYSRYERQHPAKVSTTFPAKGTVGYFAAMTDVCGTAQPELNAGTLANSAYEILAKNVVKVQPTTDAQAGSNANVGSFLEAEKALELTSTKLVVPKTTGVGTVTYTAGEACPKGTKYAGQTAYPELGYWTSISQTVPSISNDPTAVVFTTNMRLSFAFVPKKVSPLPPTNASIAYMFSQSPVVSTTTTTPATLPTTTTVPVTTTTKG